MGALTALWRQRGASLLLCRSFLHYRTQKLPLPPAAFSGRRGDCGVRSFLTPACFSSEQRGRPLRRGADRETSHTPLPTGVIALDGNVGSKAPNRPTTAGDYPHCIFPSLWSGSLRVPSPAPPPEKLPSAIIRPHTNGLSPHHSSRQLPLSIILLSLCSSSCSPHHAQLISTPPS